MRYKDELQKKNEEKLNRKLEEQNVPLFIQRYFINLESKASALNYWSSIRDLLLYLMENKIINRDHLSHIEPDDFYNVESEDITKYLKQRESEGMMPTTLCTKKNIFSGFWNYLKRTKCCPVNENIVESVSYRGIPSNSNNLIKKFPNEKQIQDMISNINNKKNEFIKKRNLCMLRVLIGTGMRESELAGLDISDLFLDGDDNADIPFIKILGKGQYHELEMRRVYPTGDACKAIREMLDLRESLENIIDVNAVFINSNGKRLRETNIKYIFETYGSGVTPHMIRHWYATVMPKKIGFALTQNNLGHKSAMTTSNNYINAAYDAKEILLSI